MVENIKTDTADRKEKHNQQQPVDQNGKDIMCKEPLFHFTKMNVILTNCYELVFETVDNLTFVIIWYWRI